MCIFESDTVKSDCPMQENYEIVKDLIQTVCFGDIKKSSENKLKKNKKSYENDQSTGHFQSFFSYFFSPPDPKSEKNSRKSTNKKCLALQIAVNHCLSDDFAQMGLVIKLETVTDADQPAHLRSLISVFVIIRYMVNIVSTHSRCKNHNQLLNRQS